MPWLALTLVEIKFARKSKLVSFSRFGYTTQVNVSWVTSIANEIEHSLSKNGLFFATCVYLRGNLRVRLATQRKSWHKFNLRPLATTFRSVWPGHIYAQKLTWYFEYIRSLEYIRYLRTMLSRFLCAGFFLCVWLWKSFPSSFCPGKSATAAMWQSSLKRTEIRNNLLTFKTCNRGHLWLW